MPDALWSKVEARRAATLERYSPHRSTHGKLNGRPEAGLIAQHLLNGFLVCTCGGAMTFMSKNRRTKAYYCTRRAARGSAACSNNRGIPEAKLDAAVLGALHKVVKDPATAWALIQERTERWRQEQALSVDVRANLEREEKKLEAAIERLLDNMEADADVGLRLKTRRAELDALRVRLASDGAIVQADEEAFERMLRERAEQLRKNHGPALGGCAKSHPPTIDAAQTRAAMRALGLGKVVVTPTSEGWTFAGDGNLAGLVSGDATRDSRPSPRFPHPGTFSVEPPPGPRFATLV